MPEKFRILCIRVDRIGDMLVSTPVLRRLKEVFPGSVLDVITSPQGKAALEGNDDADHIFVYDRHAPLSWTKLMPHLFSRHDLVVNFNAASHTCRLITSLARGARKGALNKGILAPWSGRPEDEKHYSAKMLRELEAEFRLPHDEHPSIHIRFSVPPAIRQEVLEEFPRTEGRMRVGMFIGNIRKTGLRWPEGKFAALAKKVIALNPDIDLVIVAGQSDAPLLGAFDGMEGPRLRFFVGGSSLQKTAALIKTCDSFVTSTSSPQHLAAAMDVPTVSVTYPWSEELWTPRGPLNFSAVSDINDDVRGIPVQDVYEALRRSLRGAPAPWSGQDAPCEQPSSSSM